MPLTNKQYHPRSRGTGAPKASRGLARGPRTGASFAGAQASGRPAVDVLSEVPWTPGTRSGAAASSSGPESSVVDPVGESGRNDRRVLLMAF